MAPTPTPHARRDPIRGALRAPRSSLWLIVGALLWVVGCGAPGGQGDDTSAAADSVAVAPAGELPDNPGPEATGPEEDSTVVADVADANGRDGIAEPVEVPADPPTFRHPEHVRGIYLNAWTAGSSRRVEALIALAHRTEINTFVIDIKDASGYVSHASAVPLAREVGATGQIRIPDLPGLLRRLSTEGIYPIARIVVVKDPLLVAARPDLAVQDTAGGVWVDGKDIRWLNPYDHEVWDYHVDLAREVARLGFPEIQWDYVRFPDAPRSELERATFPGGEGISKPDGIRAFLNYAREQLADLGVVVTADVFGVTTSAEDVGIGQVWERFIDVVDVAQPMVYPSHYWKGSFGIAEPNAHPYEVVKRALSDARRRSQEVEGAGATRPWLQAFTLGKPPYGPPEIRAQIQAAYDVGIEEWILWNPSSHYEEGALEPVGGFPVEPDILVAGQVVPVSERYDALQRATAQERDSVRDVPAAEVPPDTAASTGPVPDTAATGPASSPPDTSHAVRRPGS